MGVKISELDAKSACSPGDLFAIADAADQETYKISYTDLREQLREEISQDDPDASYKKFNQSYYGLNIGVIVYDKAVAHVQVKGTATTYLATNGRYVAIDTSAMGVKPSKDVSGYSWINAALFAKYEWTTQGVLRLGPTRNAAGEDKGITAGASVEFSFMFLLG